MDELALEFLATALAWVCGFAVAEFAVVGFAVLVFVLLVGFELAAEACPSAARGEAPAHIRARAQPVPNHLRSFARCFRFGFKGNPQTSERTRSTPIAI